jgi:hypothetical protein
MPNKRLFKVSNLIVLAVIAGFAVFVWKSLKHEPEVVLEQIFAEEPQVKFTGCKQQLSFELPFEPEAIALRGETAYVSLDTALYLFTLQGEQIKSTVTGDEIMDIHVSGDRVYVLHPASVEIYDSELNFTVGWGACDDHSIFGQLAVAGGKVYVTDTNNKLIWRFSTQGAMEGQIKSPAGFVVPGYRFAITAANDTLYCANPGLHKIERYTLDGKPVDTFGSRGTGEGSFAGCCNPCGIVITARGDLFTAEKGIARSGVFSTKGAYRGTLLSNRQLAGGNVAPLIAGEGNTLAVAYKNTVRIFGYE